MDAASVDATAGPQGAEVSTMALTMYRVSTWLKSPRPYLMLIGFAIALGFWFLSVEIWKLPRFQDMPGPTEVFTEWFSKDPYYGLSVYTCLLYTSPSPRDATLSRIPSSA